MKIIVADDHSIVRRGLQGIIARKPDWIVAAEAETAEELFEALRRDRYDILVLDLMLRNRSGLDLLPELRREYPSLPVLMLSMHSEEQYAIRCLRAGARGYVQKDSSLEDLLEAIGRVAAGRTWVSSAVAEQLATQLVSPSEKPPHELLSPREFEVFRMIATGQSITEIAGQLHVSVKTVSTYRTRILEKTGFHSNADIVAYAVRNSMV
ncbi:MAG: response regulator transcription factor [Acidobacteria bacterium]|nr:response regulator transcription factor [Acidobacteriota bacterium]MBV9478002.1 response regulator transcription factor [Acidobacteriota bacterium]